MKIAMVGSQFADRRNMEHLVYRVGTILQEQHSVEVVGPSQVSPRISEKFLCTSWDEIHAGFLSRLIFRDPITKRISRLVKYVRNKEPDLLLALGSIGVNGLAVAIAGRLSGVPGVVRLTSDVFQVYKTKPGLRDKISLFVRNNLLGRLSLLIANRVLLLHEAQRHQLGRLGFDRDRVRVVPQPISLGSTGDVCGKTVRADLGIGNSDIVVLSTMRLDNDKEIEKLIDVVNVVLSRPQSKRIHFVIVGEGECKNQVKEGVRAVHKNVHMVGEQASNKLPGFYAAADIFVHLSKGEGLSNCIVEALHFGLPVIANDSGRITRGLVSTILNDPTAIAHAITKGDIACDPIPNYLSPEGNRKAWLSVVNDPF